MIIDTHQRILPGFFWQATENDHAAVGGLAPLRWSKEAAISFMDYAGTDVAIVSLSTPGVHTGDSAKARALARRCNEFSAEVIGRSLETKHLAERSADRVGKSGHSRGQCISPFFNPR